jgi:protein SCO1/2
MKMSSLPTSSGPNPMRMLFLFALFVLLNGNFTAALENPEKDLQNVGFDPILGSAVDLSLRFTSQDGKDVSLRDLIDPERPTIIIPVYFNCPRLCGLLMSGVVDLLNKLKLTLGVDYRVIAVSFDSQETVTQAAQSHSLYGHMLLGGLPPMPGAWNFLIGNPEQVTKLMKQLGFSYVRDGQEWAHSAGFVILTPGGKVSQFFTGINFPAWDVKLALVEASEGKVGSPLDHIALFCVKFDPLKGKYTWAVTGLLRLGGIISIVLLGGTIGLLIFRERMRRRKSATEVVSPPVS